MILFRSDFDASCQVRVRSIKKSVTDELKSLYNPPDIVKEALQPVMVTRDGLLPSDRRLLS